MRDKAAKAEYDRKRREEKREEIAAKKAAYAKAHPEKARASQKRWRELNPERSREIKRKSQQKCYVPHPRKLLTEAERKARVVARVAAWREANPEKFAAQQARRVPKPRTVVQKARHAAYESLRARRLKHAQPKWADTEALRDIYMEAAYFQLEVDHIIPLKGKLVSGLHVPENLQLLSPSTNRRKRNKYEVDHAG